MAAKVERRHRDLALSLVYGYGWLDAPWEEPVAQAIAEAEDRGRLLLEQRIREIVATSRGLGLSRGTCESLCEELLEETNEDMAKLHRQERDEDMAKAEARGRAAERADVVAWMRALRDAMHEKRITSGYVYRTVGEIADGVEVGEHVGAAGKGET